MMDRKKGLDSVPYNLQKSALTCFSIFQSINQFILCQYVGYTVSTIIRARGPWIKRMTIKNIKLTIIQYISVKK